MNSRLASLSISALVLTSLALAAGAATPCLFGACVAAPGAEARLVKLSEPVTWTTIDSGRLKGRPARLAWSDDDMSLYLQVVEGETIDKLKIRHYMIAQDVAPSPVDKQPTWAQEYWKWKSAKSFFGDPFLTIDVDTSQQVLDEPRDRNTAYLNSEKRAPGTLEAKMAAGHRTTRRLIFKGRVIGQFIDEEIFPGYTFSWSPEAMRLMAYRSLTGRLGIMNMEGETEIVGDSKDVLLPAWSESGNAIAYLERSGGKTFALKVMTVL